MIKHDYVLLMLMLFPTLFFSCDSDSMTETEENIYVIDNTRFNIRSDKTDAVTTTNGINKAIEWAKEEGYNAVKLPKGKYLIHCIGEEDWYAVNGIFALTNMTLDFTDAELYVAPNESRHYAVIQIDHVENVTIRGGHLIGDKDEHINKNQTLGYGIHMIASRNVTIEDVKIENMTGDAIAITTYTYMLFYGRFYSKNVRITGCDISNCRRQGIHAIHVKELEISGNSFHNLLDVFSDQYAIDINPNPAWNCVVENVRIHNNTIKDSRSGVRLWSGSDIEIYDNLLENHGIYGIACQRARIHRNMLGDNGSIFIGERCEDVCVPTEGENKNICFRATDNSTKTEGFTCQ